MALAPVVENLDTIPEGARSFYKEVDGKFVIDLDVESHPQVQGLKNAYKADHEKVRTLQGEVTKFKDVDTARWESMKHLTDEDLALLERIKVDSKTSSGNGSTSGRKISDDEIELEVNKRLTPMKTAHQRELEAREALLTQQKQLNEKLQMDMRQTYIRQALGNACAAEGVIPGAIDEVVLYSQQFFKINEQNEVVAVDGSGMEVFGTDGKPMKPREWIASRGAEKNHWFPISGGGGAGGARGSADSHIMSKKDFKDLKAKVAYISAHGRTAFENLPD